MSSLPLESPYPVGAVVRDPRLLQLRRGVIDRGLEIVVSAEDGEHRHAIVIGEPHSGRTSVLTEILRRAQAERGQLVVSLHGGEEFPVSRGEMVRHLMTALVEALARVVGRDARWYRAWSDRVYLRDGTSAREGDRLSSALVLAGDPQAGIDRSVLERDLEVLVEIAREADLSGIVVAIDDATPLTEDVPLIEELVDVFDSVGNISLLLTGLPSVAGHFTQAASCCLERLVPVWLEPFFRPPQIYTALSAPLSSDEREKYVPRDDLSFVIDLLNLTLGSPYELMVVANYLWLSCERGEQKSYALTPRLLDRVIPHLALRTADGDALRNGADAIERLPEEQIPGALELAGLSQLSVREVAIDRLLKAGDGRIPDDRRAVEVTDHLEEEVERVRGDLAELEDNGVVQIHSDGERFSIVGGRAVAVLLKYKARARIGTVDARPYGQNFLHAVGQPLARTLVRRALAAVPGAKSLGYALDAADRGLGSRSPRPALRSLSGTGEVTRLIRSESEVTPWSGEAHEDLIALATADEARLALVCTSIGYGGGELEYMELWSVPEEITDLAVSSALGAVSEDWGSLVTASELSWRGVESVVVKGEVARKVVYVLLEGIAAEATIGLFEAWSKREEETGLNRAMRTCEESIAVMRSGDRTDLELGGELSATLSRLGFLQSLDDSRLEEARSSLEEARQVGKADSWATGWNLGDVLARQGLIGPALELLDQVAEEVDEPNSWVTVLFTVPGRPPAESLVRVTSRDGIDALFALKRAILQKDPERYRSAIERAADSCDDGVILAAAWADAAGPELGVGTLAGEVGSEA
jgi:hypothetical protein